MTCGETFRSCRDEGAPDTGPLVQGRDAERAEHLHMRTTRGR